MDFYTNIHKSRGDRGSSIIASSDTVSPFNYSTRDRSRKQQKLPALSQGSGERKRSGETVDKGVRKLAQAGRGIDPAIPREESLL